MQSEFPFASLWVWVGWKPGLITNNEDEEHEEEEEEEDGMWR